MQKAEQGGSVTRRSRWLYGQAALLIMILALLAGGSAPQVLTKESCLPGQAQVVRDILKSITKFELIELTDVQLHRKGQHLVGNFPIAVSGGIRAKQIFAQLETIRAPGLPVLERDATIEPDGTTKLPEVTQILFPAASPIPFKGSVILDSGAAEEGDNLVALYFLESEFISGFLLDNDGWFFIEPVRPLLKAIVGANQNPPTPAQMEVDACFPLGSHTHILYRAKDTDFSINLDPTPPSPVAFAPSVMGARTTPIQGTGGSAENREAFVDPTLQDPPIQVTLVADQAFFNLYTNVVQDKTWWEAQEEVLTAVDAIYSAQFASLSFQGLPFFQEVALEGWARGGPGTNLRAIRAVTGSPSTDNINAYELLCEFAQGYPAPPAPARTGWPHIELPGDTLVYLFSGQDLGPFPVISGLAKGIRDGGDGICETSCGRDVGTDIIGLAEGIGGLSKLERKAFSSRSCPKPPAAEPHRLDPAHHALSQQVPKPTTPGAISSASNYDATLLQRVLLTAHEFGHVLCARHDSRGTPTQPCTTIMCPVLNQNIDSVFSSDSQRQITTRVMMGNCSP